jgi:hypothetical protein
MGPPKAPHFIQTVAVPNLQLGKARGTRECAPVQASRILKPRFALPLFRDVDFVLGCVAGFRFRMGGICRQIGGECAGRDYMNEITYAPVRTGRK